MAFEMDKNMITEPLFRDNILSNIYNNFAFYFRYFLNGNLYIWMIAVIAFLLLNWIVTKFYFQNRYADFAPNESYTFSKKHKSHWFALCIVTASFLIYCGNTLWQEISIYTDFDSMSWYYTLSFSKGILPAVDGHFRYTPLQGIDLNIIFGISNNTYFIHSYIFLKQLLILWLMYILFDFIPVFKRLIMIAIINLLPSLLWINSAIFPEQNVIIFVLLSLIFLRRFQQTGFSRYLLYFMIFMNLALYSKETVAIFYGGFGIYLLISAVMNGKIALNSFLHPIKCIRQFPVEYLMFWSLFIFATGWMLLTDFGIDNRYLMTHGADLNEAIKIYQTEILINVLALIIMFIKLIKTKTKNLHLFTEGSLIGCTIISYLIVLSLRLVPTADYSVPYYLYLPAVFCTVYIFTNITSKLLLSVISILIITFAGYCNLNTSMAQQGKERRDIAEYLISHAKFMETTIYIDVNAKYIDTIWWKTKAWANALLYSYPDIKIKFKLDPQIYNIWYMNHIIPVPISNEAPIRGDYILVNKTHNPGYIPDLSATIAYENKVYTLYHLE